MPYMTKEGAIEWVHRMWDLPDYCALDREDLEEAFMAYFGRYPDDCDRDDGLWTMLSKEIL